MVIIISLTPIPLRISALIQERNSLFAYPKDRLVEIIQEIGFHCTGCAQCCTRSFNGHVFLLDRDVEAVRKIDPLALEPAPDSEFCDQNGTFYVSGYALRAKDDPEGSCWFLEKGKCTIYENRFAICRVYPYMLHREPDDRGKVDWRQFSGLDEHGEYHMPVNNDECETAARITTEYENAFFTHEISFLEFIRNYFARNGLRHVQKIYDDRMRAFGRGEEITVMVYYDGGIEEHYIRMHHPGKKP